MEDLKLEEVKYHVPKEVKGIEIKRVIALLIMLGYNKQKEHQLKLLIHIHFVR